MKIYFTLESSWNVSFFSRVQSASGIKFTVDIDFEKVITDPKLSQGSKDSIGSIIYDQYLGELSLGFKAFCQEPLQKEAVNELATARKITYVCFSDSCLFSPFQTWPLFAVSFAVYENKQDWDAAINKPGSPDYCRSRINSDGALYVSYADYWISWWLYSHLIRSMKCYGGFEQ